MTFDCFSFLNEFDILEIRLNELNGLVDRFILVEADRTFSNKPKPFYFEEQKKRFEGWPIDYVQVTEWGNVDLNDAWAIEKYQKEICVKTIIDNYTISKNDYIICSDVDEIPKKETVNNNLDTPFRIAALVQGFYYYYLNCLCNRKWKACKIARYYDGITFHQVRRGRVDDIRIPDGGWHFSYMGDAEQIKYKIDSFAHTEYAKPPYNTLDHIHSHIKRKRDMYDRSQRFAIVDDLDYLPEYVKGNLNKYKEHLCYE